MLVWKWGRKVQKVLLGIGIVVLIALIGAAVYFSLGLNSKPGLFAPPTPAVTSVLQPSQVANQPGNAVVIVDPTNSGWTVNVTNPAYLQQKLSDFGFWNANAITVFDPTTKQQTATVSAAQATFSVSNTASGQELFGLSNEVSFTPYFNSDNGSLAMHFTITNPTGQKISDAVISAAYFLTHPDAGLKLIPADQVFITVSSK